MDDCEYCREDYQKSERTILENDFWFAKFDGHPVNPGHVKIIPKRHVEKFSELNDDEATAFLRIYREVEKLVQDEYHPDGINPGWNQGKAAGQTKPHLHIHFMTRYKGDKEDPTGGVRDIIPGKGNYLKIKA